MYLTSLQQFAYEELRCNYKIKGLLEKTWFSVFFFTPLLEFGQVYVENRRKMNITKNLFTGKQD